MWHYQTTPGESWDYTATQHIVLADLEIEGTTKRKVLMQAPKNGFFYVLDRQTGELLSADPVRRHELGHRVDLETGAPSSVPEADWNAEGAAVTPSRPWAGHNWHPMTFSPQTGLGLHSERSARPTSSVPRSELSLHARPLQHGRGHGGALMAEYEGYERAATLLLTPTHITAWDPVAPQRRSGE